MNISKYKSIIILISLVFLITVIVIFVDVFLSDFETQQTSEKELDTVSEKQDDLMYLEKMLFEATDEQMFVLMPAVAEEYLKYDILKQYFNQKVQYKSEATLWKYTKNGYVKTLNNFVDIPSEVLLDGNMLQLISEQRSSALNSYNLFFLNGYHEGGRMSPLVYLQENKFEEGFKDTGVLVPIFGLEKQEGEIFGLSAVNERVLVKYNLKEKTTETIWTLAEEYTFLGGECYGECMLSLNVLSANKILVLIYKNRISGDNVSEDNTENSFLIINTDTNEVEYQSEWSNEYFYF